MVASLGPERRRRLLRRGLPALFVIGVVVVLVLTVLVGGESDEERAGERFAAAWERGDIGAMYDELTPAARERTSLEQFEQAYARARTTATITRVETADADVSDGAVHVPVAVSTRAFGAISGRIELSAETGKLDWQPHHVLPGVPEGATLMRSTTAPPRAKILARDGTTIVEGPAEARTSPLGASGTNIAGRVELAENDADRRSLEERGFPPGTPIGINGLERILERQVAGTPGGTLSAGGRTLARTSPRPSEPVRTTLDTAVQEAAVDALAGRLGGVAALDPRNGEVRALAGIAFSAPQPPGSTFKIVTAAAALEERIVKPSSRFPVETKAVIDGVDLENANGETCGGSFVQSFAHSCNSVFAPLGVELGATRLVQAAERFGFNREPRIAGAQPSTLPPAEEIDTPLAVASTAIGQGRVLATPLELATMAQTIAAGGLRYEPTLLGVSGRPDAERVVPARIARQIERMMIAVVREGTGTAASLPRVRVAGKTGTAELEDTTADEEAPGEEDEPPGFDTDAWFTAYAPAKRPKLAVAVLLVRAGAGGETAAPAAKSVLQAGL